MDNTIEAHGLVKRFGDMAGPYRPGTSTGSAAALVASRPAGSSREHARTTMMARRIGATSPGTGSRFPGHPRPRLVRTRRSLPKRAAGSSPVRGPPGTLGGR